MTMCNAKAIFTAWAEIFAKQVDELTKLDSVAGDADLGLVMNDGFAAVAKEVKESTETDLGKLFYQAGKKFNNVAPSSMGTLISAGLMNAGKLLRGKTELKQEDLVVILSGIAEGVQKTGNAKEGEKTFLDAMFPAVRAMDANKEKPIDEMMEAAVSAAKLGVQLATNMVARHGRIAFRKENSIGIVDPGSVAAAIMVEGMANAVKKADCQ